MRARQLFAANCFIAFIALATTIHAPSQSFPVPKTELLDAKHKEQKSGLEMHGNELVIRTGVGTPTSINFLSFSMDGTLLAAAKDFGRVVIWDLSSNKVAQVLNTGQGIVQALAISPDNQTIATAGGDAAIKIWRIADAKLLRSLPFQSSNVRGLSFVAGPPAIIVWLNEGSTYVLDPETGQHRADFPGEWGPVLSLDGLTLMTASKLKFIFRNVGDWQAREIARPTSSAVPMSLDTKAGILIYGDSFDRYSFVAFDIRAGAPLPNPRMGKLPNYNQSAGGFASLGAGERIVAGHSDGRLWLWNFDSGKICTSDVLYSESGALSPNGKILVGAIDNGFLATTKVQTGVLLWDMAELRKKCQL